MKQLIEEKLHNVVLNLYKVDKPVVLSIPPSKFMGDFSTNIAFVISREIKKSPLEVANEIKENLSDVKYIKDISVISPGFINFFINPNLFIIKTIQSILEEKDQFLSVGIEKRKKVSIEHTAGNPNKHLHIGHLRNFSIGDTLVRLFSKAGFKVSVQYFNNDQGLQVAKVIWGFRNQKKLGVDPSSLNPNLSFDSVAAIIYVAAEKELVNNPVYEEEVRTIIKKMEEGRNEIARYSEEITRKILLGQIKTVEKFGVYYDEIVTESSMTQSGIVEKVMYELLKTGKAVKEVEGKNAGCIIIKGTRTKEGNDVPDKILLRADGTAVYTGKDIALHLWKFGLMDISIMFDPLIKQFNGKILYISVPDSKKGNVIKEYTDLHLNVVDQRQSYPLQVVKESLAFMGYSDYAQNLHHLAYELVALSLNTAKMLKIEIESISKDKKWVAMSGRKGIEVSINSILEQMTQLVLEKNKEKSDKLNYEEANKIAASALRYYMVKFGYNTIIVFDIEEALRADGDSGIYLMYAYMRAKKILDKVSIDLLNDVDIDSPEEPPEAVIELVTQLSFAKEIVLNATKDFKTSKIAQYAYDLAKSFTTFYQSTNVLHEKNSSKRNFYIQLVFSFEIVYKQILEILGISAPDRM